MSTMYRVGQRVDGLYDESTDDMWYPGRIRCVHQTDPKTDSGDAVTFEVLYDDGEVEMNVRLEFLRQHVPGTICVGTRVLCRYDGGDEFYPGQVSDVQENGRYTIAYDDGEVEEDVPVDYIMEPEEEEEKAGAEDPVEEPSETMDDIAHDESQQEEEAELMNVKDSRNPVEDEDNNVDSPQDNEENVNEDNKSDDEVNNEPVENARPPRVEQSYYNEAPQSYRQNEDLPSTMAPEMSAERTYIIESLQLLEKRLGDAASTKSVLSTLVKQMRAYSQVTADLVHERGGERLIIDALKFHQSHAVIQCYGCVLLRRLCFLCVKSTNYLLRNGIVELVIQAMNAFAEDAILQASACGALAVFTRVHAGLNILIEFQVAQLVLSTLIYHKTYSVHTRQVHYYACEVLLELCELDDLQTLNLLCGEQEEEFTGDMSPISLLLFLLRQGLSLDDKKACCAVGSLLMCLAASGRRAAALILGLNGLAELSTVMARYPTEPSIQKYSSAASKQIALCSVRQSPTKRIKDTATVILREAESLEHTPAVKPLPKKGAPRRSTGTGKRKNNPFTGYGASTYSRGAAYSSSTPYRNAPAFSKVASPYEQSAAGFGSDMDSFGYPVTAPQQPSSLVILDGNLGADSGFRSTNKRKPLSKEDRQSELFDAYGIQGFPNSTNGRPYGTKRAQLKAHLASAESTWATPQHIPSSSNPYSSRSEHFDPGSAYSHRDFKPSRQNRWADEPHNPTYDPELRQPRGAKRKKKNTGGRTAFQVRVENENQLRVSRETHLPYPSPQRLGAATKRAAKARQKRISAGGHSSLTGRLNDASSESLNDYATQLFQDNASRAGSGTPTSSRLTPREKEEIRERERLSFAEKLHKMIDKAKSTLANGNMTSVPTVDTVSRSKKTGTSTKTPRKVRELSTTPSEEKRPQSKKTRTVIGSTPQDTAETRPAKPTSTGATKRAAPSSDAPTAVPRAKPTVSRTVVTPKATTDQKPRATVKPSKVPTKPVDKHQAERDKEPAVDAVPVDVAPVCSASEGNDPGQGEADVAVEAVKIAALPSQEVDVPVEPKPVEQVEPAVSSSEDVAKVEMSSDEAIESQGEVDPTPGDEGNAGDIRGTGVVAAPVEAHAPVDVPLARKEDLAPETTAKETAPEQSEPSVDAQKEPSAASEPTDDQPSGSSATVDAMYGDAYGEFDDNGGDDEEVTGEVEADSDDTQAPVTETSAPPADIPLQESKSGEALYDDGYDEFDEDEAPHDEETEETETEDAPATEPVDNQDEEPSDNIASQPPEIEVDPTANLPEVESEQFAGKETPTVAADEVVSAPTEVGGEGDESSLDDNDVGEKGDDVVDPGERETAQELHPITPDVGNNDPIVSNAEELHDGSNSVDPVADENEAEGGAHADQVGAAVDENADIGPPSDGVEPSTTDGGNIEGAEHEAEPDTSASISTSVIESTETEDVVGKADPSIEPAALENEANYLGDVVASIDPPSEEVPAISAPTDDKPTEETETSADPDESLTANDPVSSLHQDDETKKLSADNSICSIQFAAYDEENFDDEETHQEAELSEAGEDSPVTVAIEEKQEDEGTNSGEAPVKSEMPIDTVCSPDREEEESKPLATNNSELSVQSTAYEEEDFDDGAQEDAHADQSEDKAPEQESSGNEIVENAEIIALSEPIAPVADTHTQPESNDDNKPKESTVDNEALVDAPDTYGDEDFDSTAQDDLPKETTAEPSVPESMDERSEPQGLENNDSASTPESEAVAEPSLVIAENEAPGAMTQEEAENVQGPLVNEADEYNDDTQADDAVADNNVFAGDPVTEDHIESSDPLPVPVENYTNDLSDESGKPESEAPEITIPTDTEVTQEVDLENPDTSAQPATYDDDEFDSGAEEKKVTPSAATEDSTSKELEADPAEHPSDKVGDSAVATTDNIDDPVVVEATSPEPQVNDQPGQLDENPSEDAPDSSTVLDKADDSVSEVAPQPEVADVITSEDVGEQAELPVENEASVSNVVDNPVSEVAPPEPELQAAIPDKDPSQENSTTPEDRPNVSSEPENAGDTVLAENVPELEAQSSEQPLEDQNGNDELGTIPAESATQDEIDANAAESDVVDAVEMEPTGTPEKTEPVESEPDDAKPKDVEPVPAEPKYVEPVSVDPETVEPEINKPEAAPVETVEPEPVVSEVVEPEASQTEAVEPGTHQSEGVDSENGEAEAEEVGRVEPDNIESQTEDPATDEPSTVEPQAAGPETIVPDAVSPEVTELDVVETEAAASASAVNSVPVPESPLERSIDGTTPEESAAPEANEKEVPPEPLEASILNDPVASDNGSIPVAEVPVEAPVEAPTETNDQNLADVGTSAGETKEGDPVCEVTSTEEGVNDQPPNEKPVEDTTSLSVGEAEHATYDDDEFDSGAEEKEVTPSAATEDSTSKELEADPAEHPSDKVGDSAVATTDNIDDPVVVEATSPEPQVNDQPGQLDENPSEDAPDSSTVLDKADDSVSEVAPQPEVADVITSEDVGEQAELPVENEASVSNVVDNPVSEVAPPEPELQAAIPDKDPSQENSTTPEDRPNVSSEPENAGDTVLAENVPELEAQSSEQPLEDQNGNDELGTIPAESATQDDIDVKTEDQNGAGETKEGDPVCEVTSTEEGANDQPPNEKPVEDTTSLSVGEAEAEHPADATADEPQEPVQSETVEIDPPSSETISPADKSAGGANSDPVSLDEREATRELQSTDEVIKEDTIEVKDEPVESSANSSDATTPEPTEPIVAPAEEAQPIVEDHTSVEPDYAEDDAPVHESPIVAENESKPTDDDLEENSSNQEATEAPPEKLVVQENAEVLEASEEYAEASEAAEELAIEVEPPQSEVAVEPANATPPVSEGPKTEDQYDDDEAYNEFEEHDNETTTPGSAPSVGVPPLAAPATEAATEEEYEEYESDDYGEEENPVETPRAEPVAVPSSTHSEPPASARQEEIEEVADGPEEAEEEAYADDQDEYNNEYEEDDAPAPTRVPKPSVPDKSTPAEASDEYEDDNEEEDYAEDEMEDSPPKPAPVPAATTNKTDDEMDEEVGYDSEEYAELDG